MSDSSAKPYYLKQLPTPKGHWLWGHLLLFKNKPRHLILEEWSKACNTDIFRIRFLTQTVIVSCDPDLNDKILKNRPRGFRRYHKIAIRLEELGVLGTFSAEGETWYRHRKIMSGALTLKKVKDFHPEIALQTNKLIEYWRAKEGVEIDVQKDLTRFAADVTTAVAFGFQLNRLNNDSPQDDLPFEQIFPGINERIASPFPIWKYYRRYQDKKLDAAIDKIKKQIYDWIDLVRRERQETSDEGKFNHFLGALIKEQIFGEKMSDEEIVGNVFTVLMAGQDTTANTLAWCFYYLASNSEYIEKIRKEASKVLQGNLVSEKPDDVDKMVYTSAFVQEVLRLKPVSPNLFLEALEDQCINGLKIKKGTSVLLQNRKAQRSDEHFSSAENFAPERWLKSPCPYHEKHNPQVMKPFGGGSRFCPGMNLAQYEMISVLAAVCQAFDIRSVNPLKNVKEGYAFTMFPSGLVLKLEKRID